MSRNGVTALVVGATPEVDAACATALEGLAGVGTCARFGEGLRAIGRAALVVADLSTHPADGLGFVESLQGEYPNLPLLVLLPLGWPGPFPQGPRTASLVQPLRTRLVRAVAETLLQSRVPPPVAL